PENGAPEPSWTVVIVVDSTVMLPGQDGCTLACRETMSRGDVAHKHATKCTTIRKTPLHVPDRGTYIRQGLSHVFDAPTTPEGVPCSPLSPITWLPTWHQHSQDALLAHLVSLTILIMLAIHKRLYLRLLLQKLSRKAPLSGK